MFLLDSNPYVAKLVDFAIKYSEQNNLIIMTGTKSQGFYITPLTMKPQAHLSIHSHHFATLHDMVYYFYLVFNCPHVEAYCKLVSSNNIAGLPTELTPTTIRKFYPHNDPIRAKAQLSKKPVLKHPIREYTLTYCGELVELDVLMVSSPSSNIF